MRLNQTMAAPAMIMVALIGGCASPGSYPVGSTQYYPPSSQTMSSQYGVIDSIQMVQGAGGSSGAGAVVGGVVGGVLGSQVGGGSGKTAATAAGIVGGALVGNELERRNKAREAYQIGIRLNSGGYQTVEQDSIADLRVGDRVRIENGRVVRY